MASQLSRIIVGHVGTTDSFMGNDSIVGFVTHKVDALDTQETLCEASTFTPNIIAKQVLIENLIN